MPSADVPLMTPATIIAQSPDCSVALRSQGAVLGRDDGVCAQFFGELPDATTQDIDLAVRRRRAHPGAQFGGFDLESSHALRLRRNQFGEGLVALGALEDSLVSPPDVLFFLAHQEQVRSGQE